LKESVNLIYIIGTGFSGSTILGYLLSSPINVFNAGELKSLQEISQREDVYCTCGETVNKCSIWSKITEEDLKLYQNPSSCTKFFLSLRILFGLKIKQKKEETSQDYRFLQKLSNEICDQKIKPQFILDNSKSLWRLIYLLRCQNINTKIIYVKRDIRGNISSYTKHKVGFWRGLFRYLVKNKLISRFLKKNKLDFHRINYSDLCLDTKKELDTIGKYLEMDYSQYIDDLKKNPIHVPSGNRGTTEQLRKGFVGLKVDESWKQRLTGFQKRVLNKLTEE
jgi:hypothetical protein